MTRTCFLCCLRSVVLFERRGEGKIGDAIAVDRHNGRVDLSSDWDGGKRLRRNPGQAPSSVSHLNASTVVTTPYKPRARPAAWSNPARTAAGSGSKRECGGRRIFRPEISLHHTREQRNQDTYGSSHCRLRYLGRHRTHHVRTADNSDHPVDALCRGL